MTLGPWGTSMSMAEQGLVELRGWWGPDIEETVQKQKDVIVRPTLNVIGPCVDKSWP